MLSAVELFTGAGGLGMGISLAGFKPKAVIEWDKWACDTVRENQRKGHPIVADWPLHQMDVREFDYRIVGDTVDLVAGGPPCQPFSMGGKHRAQLDRRDMFPPMIDAVRQLHPKAFIVENVKGLTRKSFLTYFNYIHLQLEFPNLAQKQSESWEQHFARLEDAKTSGHKSGETYEVVWRLLNAANYGVPQKRERVFFVGIRSDLKAGWHFPEPTHTFDALLYHQWVTGDYWEELKVPRRSRPERPTALATRLERLKAEPPDGLRWRTVRDAISDLPDPKSKEAHNISNHRYQAGARSYPGHTGSPIDLPAKTLKAGVHGVPGGENMLVTNNGTLRYFTVRESARLQTFPDEYRFHGSWTEVMRQLGNAVPVRLAQVVASSVASKIAMASKPNTRTSNIRERC